MTFHSCRNFGFKIQALRTDWLRNPSQFWRKIKTKQIRKSRQEIPGKYREQTRTGNWFYFECVNKEEDTEMAAPDPRIQLVKDNILVYPDFPKAGMDFKDIFGAMRKAEVLRV